MDFIDFAANTLILASTFILLLSLWARLRKKKIETKAATEKPPQDLRPQCIYCGGREWYAGPTGGMAQNIRCANEDCRHWFNWVPPPFDIFDDLHRADPPDDKRSIH